MHYDVLGKFHTLFAGRKYETPSHSLRSNMPPPVGCIVASEQHVTRKTSWHIARLEAISPHVRDFKICQLLSTCFCCAFLRISRSEHFSEKMAPNWIEDEEEETVAWTCLHSLRSHTTTMRMRWRRSVTLRSSTCARRVGSSHGKLRGNAVTSPSTYLTWANAFGKCVRKLRARWAFKFDVKDAGKHSSNDFLQSSTHLGYI